MKAFVYYNTITKMTSCFPEPQTGFGKLLQIIEAIETNEPITENWKGNGVDLNEVFYMNASYFKVKLKRIN